MITKCKGTATLDSHCDTRQEEKCKKQKDEYNIPSNLNNSPLKLVFFLRITNLLLQTVQMCTNYRHN